MADTNNTVTNGSIGDFIFYVQTSTSDKTTLVLCNLAQKEYQLIQDWNTALRAENVKLREALTGLLQAVELDSAQSGLSQRMQSGHVAKARRALESSKKAEPGMWICSCGKKNSLIFNHCENCEAEHAE